jgi:transposase
MRDTDGRPNESATPKLVQELTTERDRINRLITDLVRSRGILDEVIDTASESATVGTAPSARNGAPNDPSRTRTVT